MKATLRRQKETELEEIIEEMKLDHRQNNCYKLFKRVRELERPTKRLNVVKDANSETRKRKR